MEVFKCYCTLMDKVANQTQVYLADLVFLNDVPYLVAKWTDTKPRWPAEMVRIHADKLVRVDNPQYQYVYSVPLPVAEIGPRIW